MIDDVIPVSDKFYNNGTPELVTNKCLEFIKKYNVDKINKPRDLFDVVDPFMGRGTTFKFAHKHKLSCLGIDIDEKQVKMCEKLINMLH
jgi:DNA modification methylase